MSIDNEREWESQQHAARLDRDGNAGASADPMLDRYRLIAQVLRTTELAPPPDLAARVLSRLQDADEQVGSERRLTALLGLVLLPAALAGAAPQLAATLAQLQQALGVLPLDGVLATGCALLVAWAVDRVCQRRSPSLA